MSQSMPPYNMDYASNQVSKDDGHLKVLSICWYVWSAMAGCMSFFPVIYVVLGIVMLNGGMAPPGGGRPDDKIGGIIFMIFGVLGFVLILTMATLSFFVGRSIAARRGHTYCLVVSAFACLNIPIGITLGIFTFIVLLRPSVRELFARSA